MANARSAGIVVSVENVVSRAVSAAVVAQAGQAGVAVHNTPLPLMPIGCSMRGLEGDMMRDTAQPLTWQGLHYIPGVWSK